MFIPKEQTLSDKAITIANINLLVAILTIHAIVLQHASANNSQNNIVITSPPHQVVVYTKLFSKNMDLSLCFLIVQSHKSHY